MDRKTLSQLSFPLNNDFLTNRMNEERYLMTRNDTRISFSSLTLIFNDSLPQTQLILPFCCFFHWGMSFMFLLLGSRQSDLMERISRGFTGPAIRWTSAEATWTLFCDGFFLLLISWITCWYGLVVFVCVLFFSVHFHFYLSVLVRGRFEVAFLIFSANIALRLRKLGRYIICFALWIRFLMLSEGTYLILWEKSIIRGKER